MSVLSPTLLVGGAPTLEGRDAIAQRVLTVLSTRPGLLPWRPDFGCRLADLVGLPASPATLNEAEWRVREAMARWLPDITVVSCKASAVVKERTSASGSGGDVRDHVEQGLVSLGVEARLRIRLAVQAGEGLLRLELETEL